MILHLHDAGYSVPEIAHMVGTPAGSSRFRSPGRLTGDANAESSLQRCAICLVRCGHEPPAIRPCRKSMNPYDTAFGSPTLTRHHADLGNTPFYKAGP